MRLLRLDLLRYGHFTDRCLEFEPGFNLVFGANEAGKSTTLRALRQLLFGFDHRCPDAFLHPHGSLRIGAVLEDESGARLECIRRKRQFDSLRGADDSTVIAEECLERLLDGMDQAAFQQRFGIDYEQLVAGGREICAGQGDLGEILFAAASGIADLGRVQEQLAQEAGALFKPNGSVPEINKNIAQLRESRKRIKQLQLPTQDWEAAEQRIVDTRRRLQQVHEQLQAKLAARRELEQLQAALPLLARRSTLRAEAERLQSIPLLPKNFSEHRLQVAADHQTALRQREDLARQRAAREEDLERLPSETDPILRSGDRIRELQTEFGSYRKAQQDRPKLAAELARVTSEIRARLGELGRHEQDVDFRQLALTRQTHARIQRLARSREQQLARRDNVEARRQQLLQQAAEVQRQLASCPSVPLEQLRWAVQRYRGRAVTREQLARVQQDLLGLARDVESQLARLGLAGMDVQRFAEMPLPSQATIAEFLEAGERLDQEQRLLAGRQQDLEQRLAALEQDIQRLRLEEDVPTSDDLSAARQTRDEAWQWVQRSWRLAWKEDKQLEKFLHRAGGGETIEAAFEHWMKRADEISDRLRREANRVAQKAQWLADRQASLYTQAQLAAQCEALQQRRALADLQWRELWRDLAIEVRSPREMRGWREAAERLHSTIQQHGRLQDQLLALQSEGQQLHDLLAAALESHTSATATAVDWHALGELAEQMLERSEHQQREHARLVSQRDAIMAELEVLQLQLERLQADQQDWQAEWSECTAELALTGSSSPDEVEAAVEATKEVLARHREAEHLGERIRGIDADAQRFELQLQTLLQRLSPHAPEQPPETALQLLADRLLAAQTAAARREELTSQSARLAQRLEEVEQQLHRASAQLEILCHEAGGVEIEALPQLEQQSRERAQVLARLADVEEELQHLAGHDGIDALLAAANQFDSQQAARRIEELTQATAPLEAERDELGVLLGQQRAELACMDGRAEAAELEAEVASLVATTRSRAEQYLRLRLAAAVLRETIDRYRGKHQTPVLQRASELFSALTIGNFAHLRVDTGDQGSPVLVGVRPSGAVVHVDGMSCGASDQLYLALRVASLEHYFNQRRPLPFIVDDVLVMFDDARAAAALQMFADLGKQTQVIFFTHHQHLVELAAQTLEGANYSVLRLDTHGSDQALRESPLPSV